ncbi:MAG: ArsR family transcriptional regulator [Patescibacteria group bacterium]
MLKTRSLERTVKGFANHRRIQIMELLEREPELSLADISTKLKVNIKTASEHIIKLAISGLVLKRNKANNVLHKVSPKGLDILEFLRKLE